MDVCADASYGVFGTIYTSAKKTNVIFLTTAIGAIANIAFNFILVPRVGVMGAAISTFIGYFLIWIIRLADSRKILKLNINIVKDAICYVILLAQCIIMCMEIPYSFLVSAILFVGMAIKDIALVFVSKLLRRK